MVQSARIPSRNMRIFCILPCFVLLAGGLERGPSPLNTRTTTTSSTDNRNNNNHVRRVMQTIACVRNKKFRETEPETLANDAGTWHHMHAAVDRKNIRQSDIPEALRGGSVCAQASSSAPFFHWIPVSAVSAYIHTYIHVFCRQT
jgi:hypothetical protein